MGTVRPGSTLWSDPPSFQHHSMLCDSASSLTPTTLLAILPYVALLVGAHLQVSACFPS